MAIVAQEPAPGAPLGGDLKTMAEQAIRSVLEDDAQAKRILGGDADEVVAGLPAAYPGVKKYDLLEQAYLLLKEEVKPDEAFALKARLFAALARVSRQRVNDIGAAEQIDIQLNAAHPDAWLRRGISYAKLKEERWTVDMFLEAMRRTNFTNPSDIFQALAPPGLGWIERTLKAGRADELTGAFCDALAATPASSAYQSATTVLLAIMDSPDSLQNPARVERLLAAVRQHQPHLPLLMYQRLMDRMFTWQAQGQPGIATAMARAILLGSWPASFRKQKTSASGMRNTTFTDFQKETRCWGEDDPRVIGPRASLYAILKVALSEPCDAFLSALVEEARQKPEDEQLISCVLVAHAVHAPLPVEMLSLAERLAPQERLRAAWRVCEMAPAAQVDYATLAPLLTEGARALIEVSSKEGGMQAAEACRTVFLIAPWLEKGEASAGIRSLIPALQQMMLKRGDLPDRETTEFWSQLAELSLTHGDREQQQAVQEGWRGHWQACLARDPNDAGWLNHTITCLARLAALHGKPAQDYGAYAMKLWSTDWRKHAGTRDPDPDAASLLADALISAGAVAELEELSAQVTQVVSIGASPGFLGILERISAAKPLLAGEEAALPDLAFWIMPPRSKGEGPVFHWRMDVPDDSDEDNSRLRSVEGPGARAGRSALQAAGGRFDIDLYAGEQVRALKLVKQCEAVTPEGSLSLPGLPLSGWVKAVVRSPRSGHMRFREATLYSVGEPVLDTTLAPAGPLPAWPNDWTGRYGHPVSDVVPVEAGSRYHVTESHLTITPTGKAAVGVTLVALDEQKTPIGAWPLTAQGLRSRTGDVTTWVFRPSEWLGGEGHLTLARRSDGDGVEPRYFVLVSANPDPRQAERFQLRWFSGPDFRQPPLPPVLKSEWVASLGFEFTTWHVAPNLPRAAFAGPGKLVVYDTSSVPWRALSRVSSPALLGAEAIFIFNLDEIRSFEWAVDGKRTAGVRTFPLNETVSYEESPRVELPFHPEFYEESPAADGVLFLKSGARGSNPTFEAAWLGSGGQMFSAKSPGASVFQPRPLQLAWWGKDGTIAVEDAGMIQQIKVTGDALAIEKPAGDPATLRLPPADALPRHGSRQPRWRVKPERTLLRCDETSGEMISAYRVNVPCGGIPIWLAEENSPVYLLTQDLDLVRVMPPVKEEEGKGG